MFGLSLSKLLALIGILVTVWMVFRWVTRVANEPVGGARATSRRMGTRLFLVNVLGLYLWGMLRVWPVYLLGMTVRILLRGLAAGVRRSLPA